LPASDIRIAGAAMIAIRSQRSAAAAMSPREAITETSGTAAIWTITTTTQPIITALHVACTPLCTAAARSPAP
jgi:hypothetical protein